MPDLLLEIGTGEMPIEGLSSLVADLSLRVGEAMSANGLRKDEISVFYTLRRLALIMANVVRQRSDGEEVINTLYRILKGIMTALVSERAIRNDASPAMFARSIRRIVCLYGDQVIPLRAGGVIADRVTRGHWRTHREEIALPSPYGYEQSLAERGVIVDPEKRKHMVNDAVTTAAREANTTVRIDDDLLRKIADGVEWPEPVIGKVKLPPDFLEAFANAALREAGFVPFAVDQESSIYFVGFADGPVDRDVVRVDYEHVARSAVRGCNLIFVRDRKAPLAEHVRDLRGISDESGLGSLWEKTDRLRELSGHITRVIDASPDTVDRAAFLCQADRATWMVRAFPSLHGIAGSTYAALDGEQKSVCVALEQGGISSSKAVPGTAEGITIAIAQSCDDLCGLILAGTDTHDPHVVGVVDDLIGMMVGGAVDLDLAAVLSLASEQYRILAAAMKVADLDGALRACLEERIVNYIETKQAITSEIASAIPRELMVNPYRGSICASALQESTSKREFVALLGSFGKLRALLPAGSTRSFDPALFDGERERGLWREYLKAEGKLRSFLAEVNYEQAIDQLITLGSAIDRYTKDADLQAGSKNMDNNRLGLIASVIDLFARVGNFAALLETDSDHEPGKEKR